MIVVETILNSKPYITNMFRSVFFFLLKQKTVELQTIKAGAFNLDKNSIRRRLLGRQETAHQVISVAAVLDNKCGDETWMWFGSWRLMIPTHSLIDGSAPVSDLYKSTPYEFNSNSVLSQHNHSVFN